MLKVAVTGNMGSGKTSICRFFQALDIPVFYADQEAKNLYSDNIILQQITDRFGSGIITEEKQLDKKALANIIFYDQNALTFINKLIHPRVWELFNSWAESQKGEPYVVQESALTFETGAHKHFDKTILVYAPEEMLVNRIIIRDGSSRQDALNRLSKQMAQSEKLKMADYSLLNDNSTLLIPRLLEIHHELIAQR